MRALRLLRRRVPHHFSRAFTVGLDSYYKRATDQIDDGQFGAANITSPYNYAQATIYGAELSANYAQGGFSAFGNFAAASDRATDIVSSEFEFDSDELAYIDTHNIYLDQTQFFTSSAGVPTPGGHDRARRHHLWQRPAPRIRQYRTLPAYWPVNARRGAAIQIRGLREVTLRFDVTNLFDQSYELNDGTGIGVGAPRYGMRRGFYGGLSCFLWKSRPAFARPADADQSRSFQTLSERDIAAIIGNGKDEDSACDRPAGGQDR